MIERQFLRAHMSYIAGDIAPKSVRPIQSAASKFAGKTEGEQHLVC